MAREFGSMGEFALFLGELVVAEHEAEHRALERSAVLVERTAKRKLGHEQNYWPDLAQSTLDDKERRGYPIPSPLLREGDLRDSINHRVEDSEAEVGSDSDIAVWQEMGTSKMPPRSFLASSAVEKEAEIVEIVGTAVHLALTGASLGGARIEQEGPWPGTSEE